MKRFLAALYISIAVCFTGFAQAQHQSSPQKTGGNITVQEKEMFRKMGLQLPQQSKEPEYSSWKEAMERYDYQQAISLLDIEADSLRKSIDMQQDSLAAEMECQKLKGILLKKASCQKSLYKFNDAIATLDEALRTGGEDAVTFAGIAECHILSGNNIAAYMFYDSAIRMDPENLFLRIQKLMLLYKMEDYPQCVAEGRHILSKDSIPSILITVGNSFNKMNQGDSALVYYNRAYRMNPYDYRTLEKISNIYLGRERFDTVMVLTANYLERDSTNHVISPIKGLAQYGLKDYAGAYRTFSKSLEYGCDELSGYWYLGLCKFMEKEYGSAIKWFNKAAKLDSTDVNLQYYLGTSYKEAMSLKYAKKHFHKAESLLQPDSSMMYKINVSLAETFVSEGKPNKAVEHYKTADRYDPDQPALLVKLGYAYRLQKDYAKAMECYEKYFTIGKKDSAVWKFAQKEVAFIKEEQFMLGE